LVESGEQPRGAIPGDVRARIIARRRRRVREVERRLGGEPAHVPHRNKSPHGGYRDYYSDATRDKVAEVYAADLEAFGYTF
jgi:hypothetical protein